MKFTYSDTHDKFTKKTHKSPHSTISFSRDQNISIKSQVCIRKSRSNQTSSLKFVRGLSYFYLRIVRNAKYSYQKILDAILEWPTVLNTGSFCPNSTNMEKRKQAVNRGLYNYSMFTVPFSSFQPLSWWCTGVAPYRREARMWALHSSRKQFR